MVDTDQVAQALDGLDGHRLLGAGDGYVDVAPGLTTQVFGVFEAHDLKVDGKALRRDDDGNTYNRVFLKRHD